MEEAKFECKGEMWVEGSYVEGLLQLSNKMSWAILSCSSIDVSCSNEALTYFLEKLVAWLWLIGLALPKPLFLAF